MRKKLINAIISAFTLVLICLIFISPYVGKTEYSAPTMAQVKDFISKNSINVLSIKETGDFAIVLFENEQEQGHYTIYKDQSNQIYSRFVKGTGNPKSNSVSLGGVASGKTPFVTVIINDEAILQKASQIEIHFTDGNVVKDSVSGKGIIVPHINEKNTEPINYRKIIIYDKAMTKLYEK